MRVLRQMHTPGHWRAWLAVLVVASIMTAFASRGIYPPGDVELARLIQSGHALPLLQAPSSAFYQFGFSPFYPMTALAGGALAVARGRSLAAIFLVAVCVIAPKVEWLKDLVERPRPSAQFVSVVAGDAGFSFPSGHVFGTVLLVGFLWYLAVEHQQIRWRRIAASALAISVVALMGLQRIYAGAHWPTDVVASILWGGLVLFVLVQGHRTTSAMLRPVGPTLLLRR